MRDGTLKGGPGDLPIKKPWDVCTNEPMFEQVMGGYGCPWATAHPFHCVTGGSINKRTERYSHKMCKLIHKSWKLAVNSGEYNARPVCPLVPMSQLDAETGWGTTEWECPAMPVADSWDGYQHRRKDGHT